MGWQWHQLDHAQIICTPLQTDNHAITSSLNFFTGRMLFWCPTNSVKALNADTDRPHSVKWEPAQTDPVWRSPIISSRCPRPIGTRLSTALMPVCIGSLTEIRGIMPGALTPTRALLAWIGPWTTHIQHITHIHTVPLQPFYGPFSGPPGWAGAKRKLLDFMVQGKINRDRNTDHTAGCHNIRTNQCPPPPSSPFFYRPDALPAAQPTVSKHWRQLAHSD